MALPAGTTAALAKLHVALFYILEVDEPTNLSDWESPGHGIDAEGFALAALHDLCLLLHTG